eukprot:sb/3466403/
MLYRHTHTSPQLLYSNYPIKFCDVIIHEHTNKTIFRFRNIFHTRNRNKQRTNQNSLFRSRDWSSTNQGPVFHTCNSRIIYHTPNVCPSSSLKSHCPKKMNLKMKNLMKKTRKMMSCYYCCCSTWRSETSSFASSSSFSSSFSQRQCLLRHPGRNHRQRLHHHHHLPAPPPIPPPPPAPPPIPAPPPTSAPPFIPRSTSTSPPSPPPIPNPNPPFFFFFLESSLEELLEDLDFLPPKPILGPLRSKLASPPAPPPKLRSPPAPPPRLISPPNPPPTPASPFTLGPLMSASALTFGASTLTSASPFIPRSTSTSPPSPPPIPNPNPPFFFFFLEGFRSGFRSG